MTNAECQADIERLKQLQAETQLVTERLAQATEARGSWDAKVRAAEIREAGRMAISIEAAERSLTA